MTYSLINAPFLLVALAGLALAWRSGARVSYRALWIAVAVMMALTAIFDNAIIGFGLVAYDDALISGLRIGVAPLEDFAYTVAALLIIPALWHALVPRKDPS